MTDILGNPIAMNIDPAFVPVGTIIAYAGSVKEQYEQLEKDGWLVCDGREVDNKSFPELHENIGSNYGSSAEGIFNVPDLRGLFVRGVSGPSVTDPDKDSRIALNPGGNTGNDAGSYQGYATAPPVESFNASIKYNYIYKVSLDSGCDVASSGQPGSADAGGNTNGTGGDLETRPVNKYVYFLIKCRSLNQFNEQIQIPIGAVIPFTASPQLAVEQQYIICSGDAISNLGKFESLFNVIQYMHGKAGNDFNLPDYRGFFLRGVDDQIPENRRDPDADSRTAPFPERPPEDAGNAGDQVGSVQQDATGYPVSGPFFTQIPYLPNSEGNAAMSGAIRNVYKWNTASVTANVTEAGGDNETRPVNMSVDWYIKYV